MRAAGAHVAVVAHEVDVSDLAEIVRRAGHRTTVVLDHDDGRLADAEVTVIAARRSNKVLVNRVSAVADVGTGHVVVVCERFGSTATRLLLAAGAAGLVLRDRAERALAATISSVLAGQICVPSRRAVSGVQPGLSTREKQVIGLVALGFSNGEIAERLFVAESTIKSHLSSAFAKLGVRSRHEAVDLVVNPAFGLTIGIMSLGAAPIDPGASEDLAGSTKE